MNNTSFFQTNDAYNLLLSHTSDDYNLPLLHTDNIYDSFMDTYFNNIMASEDILNNFGDQQISDNAFDDFDNKVDVEDKAKEMEHEVDFEDEDKEMEHEVDFENKDKEMEPESRYSLTVNQSFKTWKAVDKLLEHYSQERSFAFCITHSEIDKIDNEPWRRVYTCTKGQTYVPCKKAYILSERDRGHKSVGCPYHINIYWWKNDNQIHIFNIIGTHNHKMVQNITMVEARYHQLTKEMQDDVRLLSSCSVQAGAIIEVLQKKYLEKHIYAHNVYKIIQAIHFENCVASDAGSTYLELIKKQCDEPGYYVNAKFEGADNHLAGLISFNAGVQTMQQVKLYNGIIKKHVNGSSSLFELSNTGERLLFKEDRYQRFNEVAGVQSAIHNKDYYNRYFDLVEKSCQKFLTTAILKIQCREINLNNDEISAGMFSDDLFDAFVIEFAELISDLNHTSTHLCTCLTLINCEVVCRHFFAIMMVSKVAKFHIGNISHRWYLDEVICGEKTKINNEPANSIINNKKFGSFMHSIQEMSFKQQWEKEFSIIKKTLDLAIATGQYEELYEMHLNLMKEMEIELVTEDNCNMGDNNIKLFAASISNPVGINKNLARQENCCSICGQARPNSCTCNSDVSNNQMDDVNKEGFNDVVNCSHHENKSRHCGICGQIGHNAHTCNLDSSSKQINNLVLEGHNHKNEIRSLLLLPIASKNGGEDLNLMSSVNKDLANNKSHHCGTCRQVGHNARTCDIKR
ncbi:16535_t:CDS:2 [Cetraspora pellucida]|uniref:16535_t:CDS:1 n=1 Tax=Cetraspora pellucida TaxID=1433469 RepID=A0A9N9DMW6_9GLOM|nr:16535_t:CDS:2 [Cetraspora pellucida]